MNDVVDDLLQAKDRIAYAWGQGSDVRHHNRVCAWTALQDSTTTRMKAARILLEAAGLRTMADMWGWNDHPSRTKQDVIDLYDDAIALAKDRQR